MVAELAEGYCRGYDIIGC